MKVIRVSMTIKCFAVISLISGLFPFPLPSRASTGNTTYNLQVIIVSYQTLGTDYIEAQATMSGTFSRMDGIQGSYKVPVTIVYPRGAALCNGSAILDVVNSVFYETFDFVGTGADPFFPSLFPLARLNLGDAFIQDRGYIYAYAQWNKLVLERQRQAGTLTDPSFQIDQGKDGYLILRDLSNALRNPSDFITGTAPITCAVSDVIAFGYSQTGMLLRQFYFSGLNTELALSPDFDEGLVFEASLHALPGSRCRRLTDQTPFYAYSFDNCGGETPKKQGKVITINTETDLQMISGWKARPDGNGDQRHYRLYELAGTSHIPTSLFPLKLVGLRSTDMAEQNFADTAPVFRAMVEHLHNWINENGEPPASVFIEGSAGHLNEPLFSNSSWGSDKNLVWQIKLGEDGNAVGGIRLSHVRTILPSGQEVGGPLGIFRGTECDNDPIQNTFILDCQLNGDANIYNMAGGTFKSYAEVNLTLCNSFYDSHQSYVDAVTNASAYAVSRGWILAEEMDNLLALAVQKALDYPGCVP